MNNELKDQCVIITFNDGNTFAYIGKSNIEPNDNRKITKINFTPYKNTNYEGEENDNICENNI
jgi:hypothetical protein